MFDLVLVGGGLANGLIALAVLNARPRTRLALVEREARLGGEHTWCFHAGDLSARARAWVEPMVARRWPGYEVRFPGRSRHLDQPYAAITAERFHRTLTGQLADRTGCELVLGREATRVDADRVVLDDGRVLLAKTAVQAFGPPAPRADDKAGYQKFLGLEVRLAAPVEMERPIVMDATVEQLDGYRFMYVLPFAPDHLLVEDTMFSDGPELNLDRIRGRIRAWLAVAGLEVAEVLREETGVLPMPWGAGPEPCLDGPIQAGYGGGWFHPGTGYSIPVATRLAELVALHAPEPPPPASLRALLRGHKRQADFARLLNRMLFGLIKPAHRWKIFERFYQLPAGTISRFYSLETTMLDRARILVDRPPFLPGFKLPGGGPKGGA